MGTIYFDMDGTIANLYEVEGWLDYLHNENVFPYLAAIPMVDINAFQIKIADLQEMGYKIGVISWTAKNSSVFYEKEVRKAKKKWLADTFPKIQFDEMHIIRYGTRKDYVAKDSSGILFDDDERVRNKWKGVSVNPVESDIINFLSSLVEKAI